MSSETYWTELRPEQGLRRAVLGAGGAATVAGLAMVLLLPVTLPWRVAGAVGWTLGNAIRLLKIYQGHRRCQRIRIGHTGHVVVVAPDGCCVQATLLAGSVVLANVAWLRIESENGRRYVELLRGRIRQSEQWRRLQVIWRHLGAAA